jgi:hypothetical protein
MDPDNQVVRLCAEGMEAEFAGRRDAARVLFDRAWETSSSDFEACIAAHYVARHQPDAGATLHWNQVALERAELVHDDSVRRFYASLHLNLGHAYEQSGDLVLACRHYTLAHERLDDVPHGKYHDTVRSGVDAGRKRVSDG